MRKSFLLSIFVALALLSPMAQYLFAAKGEKRQRELQSTQASFSNTAAIAPADRASNTGAPGLPPLYPSTINVTALTGIVTKVTVTLNNINHPNPRDLDVLLVGPTGARTILMSDAGGPNLFNARTYTFDQTAGSDFPDDVTPANGSYKPFNNPGDATIEAGGIDNFPTPGPGSLNYGAANLNVFNNTNPNGTWSLYVVDDENVDSGNIVGGWTLNITSAFPTARVFDFDGDLKTDISIFRPPNGQWWLNFSSDNVARVYTFGTSTDKITPADYDGDGKTDVAFWRPSTGEWFVLRSSNLTFFSAPFGATGDIPAPGDFDGDGLAE